jgi:hypothetical protein
VSATTCTDSDNGKNFYVKGTVLDSNKVAQVDECYVLDANGGAVVKDSCGGTNCYVSEHYCETPNSIYGSVSSYRCPYGCMGGVCVCDHDNRVDPGEACDGADLKGKTCLDFDSYNSGVLKCSESCDFDTSQCVGSEGI